MDKIIAIDLGSNTLRVAYVINQNGIFSVQKSYEAIVGSARGLSQSGVISSEACERIYSALNIIKREFDFENFRHIAVATAAFRIAKNTDEIFAEILDRFGIKFRLISGESEALFINMGVNNALNRLNIVCNNPVFIDLGGASSEISSSQKFQSFNFGIISFYEAFKTPKLLDDNVKFVVKDAKQFLDSLHGDIIVLTAGVATTMAALKLGLNYAKYDANLINGTELNVDEFYNQRQMLIDMPQDKAKVLVGENRQSLIIAGITLLYGLLHDNKAKLIAIDDGLREGIAVAYFKNEFNKILNHKEKK
ncbi:Guanosine-5'-triphosphate,3'-diphosphate pyrophosphatase [Campylobacter majalis]|uniref:Guanosine-5'-triphosphate,3'-diphosphate pyrophosphatase n=1 Tax=Campylobacter majalis TaxID=2790656 RepID=A0ABN7K2I3_9BACT|nr:disulfide bond formation protein DsbA [Campylobacter majalis]CAD7286753.1 Guanosine-5'-triphosphate,3'-diphosphate pyrophosphatase [Campylobacter majalis]